MPTTILTDITATRNQFNGVNTTPVTVKTVACFNPVVVELIRKDFSGTTLQSTALPLYEAIDLGSLASELAVGETIYVNASLIVGYLEILDITGTIVTFDFLWSVGGAVSGYFNLPSRKNWYLTLRISGEGNTSNFVDIRLTPQNDGVMRAEISGALKSFIELNFGSDFNSPSSPGYTVYKQDLLLSEICILNWKENWIGSDEAFTTRTGLSNSFITIGGAFQIGDVNNGYYINYFANTEGELGSDENLPLWMTAFDTPIYFEGFPFTKTWLANRDLGSISDFNFQKRYYDSSGALISTDVYSLGSLDVFFGYPMKLDIVSYPTVAPDPDNRRTIRLDIVRDSDGKIVISPLFMKYVPVSQQDCNTFYMRWLNSLGGWDYYLFQFKVYEGDRVESQGAFETYFDSIAAVSDYQNFVGKRTTPIARVGSDFVDENTAKGLRSLKSSPKAYWYNQDLAKWIGVMVDPGTFAYRTDKNNYSRVEFNVMLPRLLNQTA